MPSLAGPLRWGAVWSGIAILLLLWPPFGNTAAYLSLIAFGVALPFSFGRQALHPHPGDRLSLLCVVAFIAIAIPMLVTGTQNGEAIFIADFIIVLLALPIALILRQVGGGADAVRALVALSTGSVVLAVLVSAYGVYIQGLDRAAGTENSPIHFGVLAVTCGFFSLAGILVLRSRWRMLLLVVPLVSLIAVGLSGTRAGLIVFAPLAIIFLATLYRTGAISLARMLVASLIALAAGTVTMFALASIGLSRPYEVVSLAIRMVSGVYISDLPTLYRLEMYGAGFKAFFDSPIFGHGWHKQLEAAFPYLSAEAKAGFIAENWGYIHNEILGFALTGGLFGLVSYAALMLAPLVAAWAGPRDRLAPVRRYLALILVIGLGTGGLTDVFFMAELPKVMLVVIGSAIVYLVRAPDRAE